MYCTFSKKCVGNNIFNFDLHYYFWRKQGDLDPSEICFIYIWHSIRPLCAWSQLLSCLILISEWPPALLQEKPVYCRKYSCWNAMKPPSCNNLVFSFLFTVFRTVPHIYSFALNINCHQAGSLDISNKWISFYINIWTSWQIGQKTDCPLKLQAWA